MKTPGVTCALWVLSVYRLRVAATLKPTSDSDIKVVGVPLI
jgi:hypothetical protein